MAGKKRTLGRSLPGQTWGEGKAREERMDRPTAQQQAISQSPSTLCSTAPQTHQPALPATRQFTCNLSLVIYVKGLLYWAKTPANRTM